MDIANRANKSEKGALLSWVPSSLQQIASQLLQIASQTSGGTVLVAFRRREAECGTGVGRDPRRRREFYCPDASVPDVGKPCPIKFFEKGVGKTFLQESFPHVFVYLTCPSPEIRYLPVVRASSPIGPRAWSFWVDIPNSAPKPNSPPSVNLVEALT